MDWRFKVANREAWIGVALAAINFLWWYGFAYGLGSGPVSEYQFIFGMPAWFFYSCVVGSLLMIILVIIVVKFFLTEVPLDEEEDHS
ncbi:sodium:pantothenate symporter [Bacillaceae bacterium JMAK1]|nr:sodium:pantothenate symporter [Bacillaceae bacterium JMAK1]